MRKGLVMLTEIKHYLCDRRPTEQDLIDAMIIARDYKCIVRLHWMDAQYGSLSISITADTSLTEAKRKVFKKYI